MARKKVDQSAIREILQNRIEPRKPFVLEDICFPEQLAFIRDEHPWVTASCSRRAGKTEVCALDLIDTAVRFQNIVCLYITLTRGNAERIIWGKLLYLNERYGLAGKVNHAKLSITFPNNSIIYLSGCKDKAEVEKFRGMPFKVVYIDEMQSFRAFIRDLIDEVLSPALMDHAGTLKLLGTPAPLKSGYFWECIQSGTYQNHNWTFFQNPFIAKKSGKTHQELLDRELKRRGVTENHPSIQREWFGKWTVDSDALVFKYSPFTNGFAEPPDLTDYVIGIDIGWHDADAIAVIGWNKHEFQCYVVEEVVKPQQGITELVIEIERLIKKYDPMKVVMDTGGLGKKIAEELRKRHSLPIQAAEKTRKNEYIELLNDGLRTKRLFARPGSRFAEDSQIVEWDYDKSSPDKLVIKSEPHSDICDAVLYCYREALHWLSEPKKKKINLNTREAWIEHTTKLCEEQLEKQIKKQQADEQDLDNIALMEMGFDESPMTYFINKRKNA